MSHYQLHYERAREFYDEGNFEGAKAAAEYALSGTLPGEGCEARVLLALSLRKLEYNDEAMQMLYEVVCSTPTAEACAEYALMCAERGRCDCSCRDLAIRAVNENPDLANAYIALFWCDTMDGQYLDALKNLRRGMHRGAEFSDSKAFDLVRGWCQEACNCDNVQFALSLTNEVVDLFNTFDFIVLHARLAEIAADHRLAVSYYKRALTMLRPGAMRNDILEAIARIAI